MSREQPPQFTPPENQQQQPPQGTDMQSFMAQYLGRAQNAWQNINPVLLQRFYQRWLTRQQGQPSTAPQPGSGNRPATGPIATTNFSIVPPPLGRGNRSSTLPRSGPPTQPVATTNFSIVPPPLGPNRPATPPPQPRSSPAPEPTGFPTASTNPTFRWPERMDQLPLSLQVKRLWESLGYERQNYVERWVQPRFGSLLDTLTDERSFEVMMNTFWREIIPRLRDQNMLRDWVRPQ